MLLDGGFNFCEEICPPVKFKLRKHKAREILKAQLNSAKIPRILRKTSSQPSRLPLSLFV